MAGETRGRKDGGLVESRATEQGEGGGRETNPGFESERGMGGRRGREAAQVPVPPGDMTGGSLSSADPRFSFPVLHLIRLCQCVALSR